MAEAHANPIDAILADLAPALYGFGNMLETSVRADLSVPVEYLAGGGVVRSKRGEHPRRETGNLQRAVQARVRFEGGDVVAVELDNPVGYAVPLETELDRPIFRDVPGRFADAWADLCGAVASGAGAGATVGALE